MENTKKKAQSLIEYGLILALVAVVAVTILGKFSTSINTIGNNANSAVGQSSTNALNKYCVDAGHPNGFDPATGQCK